MEMIGYLVLMTAVTAGMFLGVVVGWLTITGLLGALASSRRRGQDW